MANQLTGPAIFRAETTTQDGHSVQFFFNRETNLLVVDIVHKNERGGNEVLRQTLDPAALLAHCEPKRRTKRGQA